MRICHLIYDDVDNPWLAGGGALRAREIYRRLARDHEVTLVSGRYPGARTDEQTDGIRIIRVGSERGYALSRLGYMRLAPRILQSLRWDLWVNEFSAFAPLRIPRGVRRRGVLQLYHLVGHHAIRKHPLIGSVAWLAERRVVHGYPRIITISPSVRRAVCQQVAQQVEVDCVATGVDGRYFDLQRIDEPYILYLGRTDVHTKGLDLLVAAFTRVADEDGSLRLVIAGRGHARQADKLRAFIAASSAAPLIQLLGPVDEARKCELLRRCRLFCMPSRYEGWGIAAIEAAAAGKAVVATRISGLRDAVLDQRTGILVDAENVSALAAGLRRLLADPVERIRLGDNARSWARRFSWERVAEAQLAAYQRALAAGRTDPCKALIRAGDPPAEPDSEHAEQIT